MRRRGAFVAVTLLALSQAHAQGASVVPPRSSVFDHESARDLRDRADWSGVIVVEGYADERRRPPVPLEQRFVRSLGRRQPVPEHRLASSPVIANEVHCHSLPSQAVPFGGSYNPHGFCP